MDLFERIENDRGPLGKYAATAEGYYIFPKLTGPLGARMQFNGQEVICWSVNNYLGLGNHPEVRKVDGEAAADWGLAYPMGSRMMSGNSDHHYALEESLAEFVGKEKALLVNFGYQGVVSSTPKPESRWPRSCMQQLVKLYTDWEKPEKAAEWQEKLILLDQDQGQ